jgi:hypothetical protein
MNQEVTHKLALTAALRLGFASPMRVARHPQGPETPFDPIEPTEKEARSPPAAHFSAGINTAGATGVGTRSNGGQHRHQPPWLSNGPLADVASAPLKKNEIK